MSFLQKEISLPKLRAPKLPSRPSRPRRSSPGPHRSSPTGRSASGRRNGRIIGLEIGATQAIAAQATLLEGRIVVERVAQRELPSGLVHDGLVVAPEALADELKDLFAEHKLPKRVRVGLATPRTILRVIDLPPLDEGDIRVALQVQAQDRIPMPLEKAVLDYQTVGLVDTPEGQRLRVVVVVTEREGVDVLLDALRQAGLRAEGIDLSIFAAMRAVGSGEPAEGPTLYAQLGDLVNIAIADGGVCRFTRQAPQGLALLVDRLAELGDGSPDDARALLRAVTADGAAPGAGELGRILSQLAFELGSELRAAAEFYAAQFGSVPIQTGVVTGVMAPLPGLVPALAEASGLDLRGGEVATDGPFALAGLDPRVVPVAAGLAVAEVRS